MIVKELKDVLNKVSPKAIVTVRGLAENYHITELANNTRLSLDCAGGSKISNACFLQTVVGNDKHHRITAEKLLSIFDQFQNLYKFNMDHAPVFLEVQLESLANFELKHAEVNDAEVLLNIEPCITECVDPEFCGMNEGQCCGGNCH